MNLTAAHQFPPGVQIGPHNTPTDVYARVSYESPITVTGQHNSGSYWLCFTPRALYMGSWRNEGPLSFTPRAE